ncbi:MAG: MmgE/PrpD family protein [Candidatus Binatia bacterium]
MASVRTESPTAMIARFVADLSYESIPAEVISHIKLCILDTVGCALYGSTLPWGKIVIRFVKECGEGRGALIWGDGTEVPSVSAPLANGTMVHSFELDDIHRDGVLHPGAVTLPAVDALLRYGNEVDGREFLTATVAGYEAGCRVGLASGVSQLRRGFHPTGTTGTFASGAAAAKVLRLDAGRILQAVGIAGTQGAGLMAAQEGSMVKRMHPGRAAQSGVCAALLAANGFTGIVNILEADYGGFLSTLCDRSEMELITRGLGEEFASLDVGFKLYPCCANNHTSLDALQKIRTANPHVKAEDVERMVARTTRSSKLHVGWPYVPDSVTTAQMNLSYCLAAALIDGEFSVGQVAEEAIGRRDILEAARRIEVVEDPELDGLGDKFRYAVKLEVFLRDGTCIREKVLQAKGSEANPVGEAELEQKFRLLASKVLRETQVERLHDTICRLEKVADVRNLAMLLVSRV